MDIPLRFLIIEDRPVDVELMLYALKRDGINPVYHVVQTEAAYLSALADHPDVILSDYSLPQFSALRALELLQERNLDIPFIIVTGAISEEVAVECIKLGAADYLIKDRLVRLGQAVKHAINERKLRAAKRKADRRLRLLSLALEQSSEGVGLIDLEGVLLFANPALAQMHGYTVDEVLGKHFTFFYHSETQLRAVQEAVSGIQNLGAYTCELWNSRQDGSIFPVMLSGSLVRNESGQVSGILVTVRDISEQKRVEVALEAERAMLKRRVEERTAALEAANQELAQASQLKDEFLAIISHELRTPLNAILGMSEVLQELSHGPLNEKQSMFLSRIQESGRHLLDLINDLLDISKIEAGKLELEEGACLVEEICQSCFRMLQTQANRKSQSLVLWIDPAVGMIKADQRRLKQILVNLLGNSVKFTPDGGQITLRVAGDEAQKLLRFEIQDTGIGISEDELERVFEPFVQLESSLVRQYEGTGLGLALVRRLVELHGGEISVQSTPGAGSIFTFVIPWKKFSKESSPGKASPVFQPVAQVNPQGSKILVIEDHEANLLTIIEYLFAKGYTVLGARSGEEALAILANEIPALVIMDIQFPGMSGFDLLTHLRNEPGTADLPVIIVTAFAMPGDRTRCLEAGANEYLSKPVQLSDLLKLVEQYVGRPVMERIV